MYYLEAGIHEGTIYEGDALTPGMRFVGPAIIEEKESTIIVGEDAQAAVDEYGFVWITMNVEG